MKIRNGFVSNSSSSSFVLLGVFLDTSVNRDNAEELQELFSKEFFEALEENDFDVYSAIEGITGDDIIQYRCDEEGDEYIGIDPDISCDTKTLGEFKQEARDKLKPLFRDDFTLRINLHAGVEYNG
jgi:hypothetical protein